MRPDDENVIVVSVYLSHSLHVIGAVHSACSSNSSMNRLAIIGESGELFQFVGIELSIVHEINIVKNVFHQ